MKRLVLIGCILSGVLLITVPCIPAVESNQAIKSNRVRLLRELRTWDIEGLKEIVEEENLNLSDLLSILYWALYYSIALSRPFGWYIGCNIVALFYWPLLILAFLMDYL